MTRNEFFTVLEQALREDPSALPYVTPQGALRLQRGDVCVYCPITYAAQRYGKGEFDTAQVLEAAVTLGLRPRTRRSLIEAADGRTENQIRQKLAALWTLPWMD